MRPFTKSLYHEVSSTPRVSSETSGEVNLGHTGTLAFRMPPGAKLALQLLGVHLELQDLRLQG